MEAISKDFEHFFILCQKEGYSRSQIVDICQPLISGERLRIMRKFAIIIFVLVAVYCGCLWFDCISWSLSALGRLLLIDILPLWNWTPLYTAKCLLPSTDADVSRATAVTPAALGLGKHETFEANCDLCESLDSIHAVTNVTFSFVEASYLERGLPVIIADSHEPRHFGDFLDLLLLNSGDFLESEPCDLATNLMLKDFFTVEAALQKIRSMMADDDGGGGASDKWFMQLRNCQVKAVKASRLFVPRPYYYPEHLPPFYTSWLIMSHHYASRRQREIYVQGLVFVQQLSGQWDVSLRPRNSCGELCPTVNLRLSAGESLIFSTQLWTFAYRPATAAATATTTIPKTLENKFQAPAVTTILEIDWTL